MCPSRFITLGVEEITSVVPVNYTGFLVSQYALATMWSKISSLEKACLPAFPSRLVDLVTVSDSTILQHIPNVIEQLIPCWFSFFQSYIKYTLKPSA